MSFDWEQYLDLAQVLVRQHNADIDREAELRCAISRTYYAAHCTARNYLRDRESQQGIPLDGRAHQVVIDLFLGSRDRARRKVGDELRQLRTARVQADYFDQFGTSPGAQHIDRKARQALALAEAVIAALPRLASSP